MKSLPEVHEGDVLDGVSASVTEHFTTPPKQYTEDTLLSAMETAGNDQFDDDTEKKGLGTPATRAGIIEKLVKSGFAERKGKSLIPTKDGCNLVCVLPEQITSPAMTAEWENTLMEIERGKADADAFLSGIVRMNRRSCKATRSSPTPKPSVSARARRKSASVPAAALRSMSARATSTARTSLAPSACGKTISSFPVRKRS